MAVEKSFFKDGEEGFVKFAKTTPEDRAKVLKGDTLEVDEILDDVKKKATEHAKKKKGGEKK